MSFSWTRRSFLAAAPGVAWARKAPKLRPNVLLATLPSGASFDAAATSGVVFERAYCQHLSPDASRLSLLGGLRPGSSSVVETMPEFFRRHGYQTAEGGLPAALEHMEAHRGQQWWFALDLATHPSGFGEALAQLEKTGVRGRTVIVACGGPRPEERVEAAAHVPLVVSVPRWKGEAKRSHALVELVDVYPTVAALALLAAPAELEGQSMAPLLETPSREWKRAAFTDVRRGDRVGKSVRTQNYRLIQWNGRNPGEELYEEEAGDRRNLAPDLDYEKLMAQMRGVLDAGWKAARAR